MYIINAENKESKKIQEVTFYTRLFHKIISVEQAIILLAHS